jgi:hypothetical protein
VSTAKPRAVRCVCKNRDRHFGVCKCHRHKGDTVSELDLQQRAPASHGALTPGDVAELDREARAEDSTDVWWCAKCDREWTVPSIPHNPRCPTCGTGGWWRRFA